jgi:uncharacterized protein (TIGR02145 family)
MPPKHHALAILYLAVFAYSGDNTLIYGGKTYKTVKIGTQTWMAENLNYEAEGSKCYKYDPANCAKYGRLYDLETAKKACPEGWRLPSNEDWDKLYRFVDGDTGSVSPYESKTAGKYLKAASGWYKDGNGTDDYGFSALPGGGYSHGNFFYVGSNGYWWSPSKKYSTVAYYRFMGYSGNADWNSTGSADWSRSSNNKSRLFSVRCIQD